MSEMNRERFDDLKDAYALGALPEEELREFEAYLADHPELQAEVDDLSSIAALLAISPADQEPPRRLRKSVMAVVNAEAGRDLRRSQSSRRISLGGLRELLTPRLALGAASVLLVALLGWNVFLQSEVRDLNAQNSQLQAEVQDARTNDGQSRIFAMQGEGAMSQANAEVMAFEDDRVVLVAQDVPAIEEDQTFQIWVISGGEARPSGLFEPGEGPVAAVVENSLEDAETIAVTVEPEGGSPQPTTDPMLSVQL